MRTACLSMLLIRSDSFHPHFGEIYSEGRKALSTKYINCFSGTRSLDLLTSMRRLRIIQSPSFLPPSSVRRAHRTVSPLANRYQSFSVMSQKKHQASADPTGQPEGNNEPLPPLSPKDFRTYNRMAEQMDQFVRTLPPIIPFPPR
jgi:hypothetical protein